MRIECYVTHNTFELLPSICINYVEYKGQYVYNIMLSWMQFVIDIDF